MAAKQTTRVGRGAAKGNVLLASRIAVPRIQWVYDLPYFTRGGADTEYLISNPGPGTMAVRLFVFGKNCRIVKRIAVRLGPHCTRSVRLRVIAPEHAGHTVVVTSAEPLIHILYYRAKDIALVGAAQAGRDNLLSWRPNERSRTYGFGYRSLAVGHDSLAGAVFVSNPNLAVMGGAIEFFDQACKRVARKAFKIPAGCTASFPFPRSRYGYGTVTVSHPGAINVLHFADSAHGLASAELIGEADRVAPPAPTKRSRVLFDDTHSCRPGAVGDWTQYQAALVAAGFSVTHLTQTPVTLAVLRRYDVYVVAAARASYTAAERQAITDYVSGGGGLLIVQDFGGAPWSVPTREVLNLFGASDDDNTIHDEIHTFVPGQPSQVIFDYQRNFLPHPITTGFKSFGVGAASSLSGETGWTTVVETDDDSMPARRPAVIARTFGTGRVVAFGDTNAWADHLIDNLENRRFGVRCMEWLLFRI